MSAEMDFDVIIVGSGAGGGMAALRLCEHGLKVGLIERGPKFSPKNDYVQNYPDWETRDNPLDKARKQEETIDQNYRTRLQDGDTSTLRASFDYLRVHGVGGSTLQYQGEAHRFGEHVFETKKRFGWGTDWPLIYGDLAPYYSSAETLLGVAGELGNPFKPKREKFPTAAHPLSKRSLLLAESASAAGFSLLQNTLALPSTSLDGRLPCQHSGGCNFGCVFGAKSSIDQAIIPLANATGNLTVLTQTRVLELELESSGEIAGVLCDTANSKKTLRAKRYILATGAIETPRLMLASTNNFFPNGYANSHDQVGRYFMETVTARLHISIDSKFALHHGPPLDSRSWDFYLPKSDNVCGFVLGSFGYVYPDTGPVSHALKTPGIGRLHKQQARQTFGNNVILFGIAEQVPVATNRVLLSNLRDASGTPKVKIHSSYSKRDIRTIHLMHEKLRAWGRATNGAKIGRQSDTQLQPSSTHIGGTCRMGNELENSVVDKYGKVHQRLNCYITDASVLPTQGAGDSPSLTIQALALRTADRVVEDIRSSKT